MTAGVGKTRSRRPAPPQSTTEYLNSTPANRRALDQAIAEANSGDLIEVEFGPDGMLHPINATAR